MAPQHTFYINSRKNGIHESNFEDQIRGELERQVATYSLQSFERFRSFHGQIATIPTDNSKPYFKGRNNPIGFTKYFIEATGRPPQEVKVRIANMQIELFHGDDWTDILTILDRIPAPTTWQEPSERMSIAQKQALWQKQWQWYYHNTKTFNFFALPSEIRELIYSFLFPTTFQPYPYCVSQRRPWKSSQGIAHDQGNTSLLRVNKQLHNEAGHILFRDTTFLLERTSIMERVLSWTPALSKNLTRLELSFGHEQYLRLFGFYFNEYVNYDAKHAVRALRNLDLKLLTIRIGTPISYASSRGGGAVHSCQKKAVKHILRAAYPWVKGHSVKVMGCILEKQKAMFEGKMREKREEFEVWRETGDGTLREWDEDEGGVSVNVDEAKNGHGGEGEVQVRRDVEWPPRCRCRVHCGKMKWESE